MPTHPSARPRGTHTCGAPARTHTCTHGMHACAALRHMVMETLRTRRDVAKINTDMCSQVAREVERSRTCFNHTLILLRSGALTMGIESLFAKVQKDKEIE